MNRRIVLVGTAVLVALVLLGVTLMLSSPGGRDTADTAVRGPINPSDLPGGFNPDDLNQAAGGTLPTKGSAGRGKITRVDDQRVTVLTWNTIDPTDTGVFEVGGPEAIVEFSASRMMTVTAREATIIAPENTFRRGEFRKDVVLTFFDAEGRAVDLASTRDIQMRVFLDEDAAFDLELGQITSTGPLHLTGPMVDFRGKGLSLKYNRLRERVERLVINEGDTLRFSAAAQRDGGTGPAREAGPGAEPKTGTTPPARTDDERTQFYRAVFTSGVHVEAGRGGPPEQQADLRGDELSVLFAIKRNSMRQTDRQAAATDAGTPAPGADAPATHAQATTAAPEAVEVVGRSLMPHREDDVVVRWSGSLVVRPLMPEDSPEDSDTLELAVKGTPAVVQTGRGDSVTGRSLAFYSLGERFIAMGDEAAPLVVRSDELGELTGTQLDLSQLTGEGTVSGAGSITATMASAGDADAAPAKPSSIAWTERMTMRFFLDEQAQAGKRLSAMRHVAFHGGVRVAHEDYTLASERLELTFEQDEEDRTRSSPSLLMARGQVAASQPGMTFSAQALDAVLVSNDSADVSAGPDAAPAGVATGLADAFGGGSAVERVTAVGDVVVRLEEEQATVRAQRLVALPREQTVDLYGGDLEQAPAPAVMTRANSRLAGRHIRLDQTGERVVIQGAGDFRHQLDADDAASILAVTWRDSMAFDNQKGEATFVGTVLAESAKQGDTTRLSSGSLQLGFVPEPAGRDADAGADNADDAQAEAEVALRIRSLVARDDVVFSAATKSARPDGLPRSRILLEGPLLTFVNMPDADPAKVVELVTLVGQGRMLVENNDDSPPDAHANLRKPATDASSVNFAGHGATLFLWTGSLALDAARNDMTLTEGVQMIHRPADGLESDVVQLDCQRLYADLTETGGLTAFSSRGTPDATLRLITADQAVRLIQGDRQITSDHLRYAADTQQVTLWSDDGEVELADQAGGSSMSAQAIKWDLANDSFEATQIRGGTAPIKRE